MKYYAAQTVGQGRCVPIKRMDHVKISEVTDDRVKGERNYPYGGGGPFNVKRVGDKFSVGSGSGKTRYLLCVEA